MLKENESGLYRNISYLCCKAYAVASIKCYLKLVFNKK